VAASVLLPAAAAASAVDATLSLPDGALLDGTIHVRDASGLLDLAGVTAPGVRLAWTHAEGYFVERARQDYGMAPGAGMGLPPTIHNESLAFSAGSIGGFACHDPCLLTIAPVEGLGAVGADLDAKTPLAWTTAPRVDDVGSPAQGDPDSYSRTTPEGASVWDASGATVDGQVEIVLWGVSADVLANVSRHVETGTTSTRTPLAGGLAWADEVHTGFLVLRASGAHLVGQPAGAFLLAPQPRVACDCAFEASDASGRVEAGGQGQDVRGTRVAITGHLQLAILGPREAALPLGRAPARVEVAGSATRVVIGGETLVAVAPGPAAVAAGAGLGVVALLLGALALYTRIARSDILENANRQRLHAALQAGPPRTIPELQRATGLKRVVLRHHLVMLERSGLVASTSVGPTRLYHAGPPRSALDPALVASLRTPARAALARHLVDLGRATRADLMAASGFSKRLVSYHVRCLEAAGLVTVEGKPRRYAPAAPLRAWAGEDASLGPVLA
jgi:DNA-binding transcriptional ArsR family regulator